MRADRLLSILLLLQAKGKMTAQELAMELEVSERTIYRDMDALSFAGVPVYGEAGHKGGYALVDNYRTDLTGMTRDELRALFMLGNLAPIADLGVGKELSGALLKISASSSPSHHFDEGKIRQRFLFDSTWWGRGEEQVPHLQVVQQAVWENRKLRITYHPLFSVEIRCHVAPYALVAKAGRWYLVFERNDSFHVQRVNDLLEVRMTEESFVRPSNFDLEAFWTDWCAENEQILSFFTVVVRVAPGFVSALPRYFGNSIQKKIEQADLGDSEGWIKLTLSFESFEAARDRILGFGSGVEVLAPVSLRKSIIDYAEQIQGLYGSEDEMGK
jgi:predicted DNA-binding transcriptional regulator YafY